MARSSQGADPGEAGRSVDTVGTFRSDQYKCICHVSIIELTHLESLNSDPSFTAVSASYFSLSAAMSQTTDDDFTSDFQITLDDDGDISVDISR